MKALAVAPQPFFSPRGTPFSVYYRCLVMAEQGVEIDLLTYGEGSDVDIPGLRIIRIPRFALLGSVRLGPSLLKAFLDVFLAAYLVVLLIRNRYDFVHAHEEAVFLATALKPIFGFKLIYDMHSSLPQQLTNFQFTESKWLIGAFNGLERAALRASEAVITICPALASYALEQLDDPSKHFLIENSIFEPVRLVAAAEGEPAADESAPPPVPPRRSLLVYAGTLEPYQGIELLLRGFQKVSAQIADAFLLVVGGSPEQVEHYAALARELGLESSTHFTGRVSPQIARGYAAGGDILVSPRIDGTNTPLKIYEQLASGIPLVATSIYSHTQVLDESVAFLAEPKPEAFGSAMVEALQDETARAEKVACAQALYEDQYGRAAYVSKIRALLGTLA
jgi:glycosyltransferase involved in cell wall biosynthesis